VLKIVSFQSKETYHNFVENGFSVALKNLYNCIQLLYSSGTKIVIPESPSFLPKSPLSACRMLALNGTQSLASNF
jgi:hypothetical protein